MLTICGLLRVRSHIHAYTLALPTRARTHTFHVHLLASTGPQFYLSEVHNCANMWICACVFAKVWACARACLRVWVCVGEFAISAMSSWRLTRTAIRRPTASLASLSQSRRDRLSSLICFVYSSIFRQRNLLSFCASCTGTNTVSEGPSFVHKNVSENMQVLACALQGVG